MREGQGIRKGDFVKGEEIERSWRKGGVGGRGEGEGGDGGRKEAGAVE